MRSKVLLDSRHYDVHLPCPDLLSLLIMINFQKASYRTDSISYGYVCVYIYIYTENYISMEPLYALRLLLKEYWALWVARLSISSKQG